MAAEGKELVLYDLPSWLKRGRRTRFFHRYREDVIGFLLAWLSVGLIIGFAWVIMQL